jgi:hypothetical protein
VFVNKEKVSEELFTPPLTHWSRTLFIVVACVRARVSLFAYLLPLRE